MTFVHPHVSVPICFQGEPCPSLATCDSRSEAPMCGGHTDLPLVDESTIRYLQARGVHVEESPFQRDGQILSGLDA
jgi:hypothetical protein